MTDKEQAEERYLRQHDENPLKPVSGNMVENLKAEIIEAYEAALEADDKDTIKRMEWELSTLLIKKNELRAYVEKRKEERIRKHPVLMEEAGVTAE